MSKVPDVADTMTPMLNSNKVISGYELEFSEAADSVIDAYDVHLRNEDPDSDITIEIVNEGEEVTKLFGHRFILTRRCPALKRMIEMIPRDEPAKIVITDNSASAVEKFLRFLYTGRVVVVDPPKQMLEAQKNAANAAAAAAAAGCHAGENDDDGLTAAATPTPGGGGEDEDEEGVLVESAEIVSGNAADHSKTREQAVLTSPSVATAETPGPATESGPTTESTAERKKGVEGEPKKNKTKKEKRAEYEQRVMVKAWELFRLAEEFEVGALMTVCERLMRKVVGQPGLHAAGEEGEEGEGEREEGGEGGRRSGDLSTAAAGATAAASLPSTTITLSSTFETFETAAIADTEAPPIQQAQPSSPVSPALLYSLSDDSEAAAFRDATNAAARVLVRSDLAQFLQANEQGTFVGWIASLHPENVHLDSRMWIDDNDWLAAWKEAVAGGRASAIRQWMVPQTQHTAATSDSSSECHTAVSSPDSSSSSSSPPSFSPPMTSSLISEGVEEEAKSPVLKSASTSASTSMWPFSSRNTTEPSPLTSSSPPPLLNTATTAADTNTAAVSSTTATTTAKKSFLSSAFGGSAAAAATATDAVNSKDGNEKEGEIGDVDGGAREADVDNDDNGKSDEEGDANGPLSFLRVGQSSHSSSKAMSRSSMSVDRGEKQQLSNVSAATAAAAGGGRNSHRNGKPSFFRWGSNTRASDSASSSTLLLTAQATAEVVEEETEGGLAAGVDTASLPKRLKAVDGSVADGDEEEEEEEEEDGDEEEEEDGDEEEEEGLDPRVGRALEVYTNAISEHNSLSMAKAHANSSQRQTDETSLVVAGAIQDIQLELERLSPVLFPLDAAKFRLRTVLEAIDQHGNKHNSGHTATTMTTTTTTLKEEAEEAGLGLSSTSSSSKGGETKETNQKDEDERTDTAPSPPPPPPPPLPEPKPPSPRPFLPNPKALAAAVRMAEEAEAKEQLQLEKRAMATPMAVGNDGYAKEGGEGEHGTEEQETPATTAEAKAKQVAMISAVGGSLFLSRGSSSFGSFSSSVAGGGRDSGGSNDQGEDGSGTVRPQGVLQVSERKASDDSAEDGATSSDDDDGDGDGEGVGAEDGVVLQLLSAAAATNSLCGAAAVLDELAASSPCSPLSSSLSSSFDGWKQQQQQQSQGLRKGSRDDAGDDDDDDGCGGGGGVSSQDGSGASPLLLRWSSEEAEVEAADAMEQVCLLTEELYEASLRHHDLEVSLATLERERSRLVVKAETRSRQLLYSRDQVATSFKAVERLSSQLHHPSSSASPLSPPLSPPSPLPSYSQQLSTTTSLSFDSPAPAVKTAIGGQQQQQQQPATSLFSLRSPSDFEVKLQGRLQLLEEAMEGEEKRLERLESAARRLQGDMGPLGSVDFEVVAPSQQVAEKRKDEEEEGCDGSANTKEEGVSATIEEPREGVKEGVKEGKDGQVEEELGREVAWCAMRLSSDWTLGSSPHSAAQTVASFSKVWERWIALEATRERKRRGRERRRGGVLGVGSRGVGVGGGVCRSDAQAVALLAVAARQGRSPHAQVLLGLRYEYGCGVHKDWVVAAKWYARAAREDLAFRSADAPAAAGAAAASASGCGSGNNTGGGGGSGDGSGGSGGEVGDVGAMVRLAHLLSCISFITSPSSSSSSSSWFVSSSSSVSRHLRVAALWCRAAETVSSSSVQQQSGDSANALFRLGLLFESGRWGFTRKHVLEAAACEREDDEVADGNDEAAAASAGRRRKKGGKRQRILVAGPLLAGDANELFGTDCGRAAAYYSRAAAMGHAKAAYRLAVMHETGSRDLKVAMDTSLAQLYFSLAASNGDTQAQQRLDMMHGGDGGGGGGGGSDLASPSSIFGGVSSSSSSSSSGGGLTDTSSSKQVAAAAAAASSSLPLPPPSPQASPSAGSAETQGGGVFMRRSASSGGCAVNGGGIGGGTVVSGGGGSGSSCSSDVCGGGGDVGIDAHGLAAERGVNTTAVARVVRGGARGGEIEHDEGVDSSLDWQLKAAVATATSSSCLPRQSSGHAQQQLKAGEPEKAATGAAKRGTAGAATKMPSFLASLTARKPALPAIRPQAP